MCGLFVSYKFVRVFYLSEFFSGLSLLQTEILLHSFYFFVTARSCNDQSENIFSAELGSWNRTLIYITNHKFRFFSSLFILLSRESDQRAITISIRNCRSSAYSTTPTWENPAECLSHRHNMQTCRLVLHAVRLMLSVKQDSYKYQF